MYLAGYEIKKATPEIPPDSLFSEKSYADSSLYEPYSLRPYNPDELFQKRGNYDLFDEMRQDDQVHAVMSLKKMMILDSGWRIETKDDKIKEFIEYNLNESIDDLFEKKIIDLLSALDFGFSLTEKIFSYDQTEWGKKIVLKKLKTRPPHGFKFYQDRKGNVEYIEQETAGTEIKLNPDDFILYSYNKEFDNPYGKSELNLGVYRSWWSKNALIKFWNIYLERYGMPLAHGKYSSKGNVADREKFEKILNNLQARTSIVSPEDYVIEFLNAGGTGESDFERAIQYHNMMIARSFLVPDLLGFSGEKVSGGSYSLGQEHFGIFYSVAEQIRKEIERIINRHIIHPLILWNFGSGKNGRFVFSQVDEDKKVEQAKLWLEGVKTGKIIITPEQQNWFLTVVDAPEIEEQVFREEEERKREFEEQLKKGGEGEKEDENKDDKENEEKEEFAMKSYYRDLTEFEKRVDFEKIDTETERIESALIAELYDKFKLAINGLIDDIRQKQIIEKKRLEKINKLTLRHQNTIKNIIKSGLRESYHAGTVSASREEYIIDDVSALDDEKLSQWFEEYSTYIKDVETDFILKNVKPIISEGIRNGAGINEIMKMLDNSLSGYDIYTGADRLENIARTLTAKAFNEARKQSFLNIADEIVAYQYSAIRDGRTSALCLELDKKIIKPNELSYYNPPNHFRCRSLLVPIFAGEQFDIDKMPGTERIAGDFLKLK